ncbi:phage protein NinX family protein [Atlantibacter hermannii]|uniref:phage protein NinX family protein n=1 Tax=Atlantibacter hermannii TaxID=565 RepID=UPI00289FEFFD|nr:phage protein NinX family protein [Atlantibacter hermannii]
MNYSEMSDFEINCAVVRALGMSHAFFFSKSEDDFCEEIEPNERGPIWQSGKYLVNGYRVSNGNCFNPCNSWADAGPIIQEHGISLYHSDGSWQAEMEYEAPVGAFGTDETCSQFVDHKNPLRAAMIVFLMMQEADNA